MSTPGLPGLPQGTDAGGPRPANVYDRNYEVQARLITAELERLHSLDGYVEKWIAGIRSNIWGNTKIDDIQTISASVGLMASGLPHIDLSGFKDIAKHDQTVQYIGKVTATLSYGADISMHLVKLFGDSGSLQSLQIVDTRNPYEIPFSVKRSGFWSYFKNWTTLLKPGIKDYQKSIGLLGAFLQDWRDASVKWSDFVRAYGEARGKVIAFSEDSNHFVPIDLDDILTDVSTLILPVIKKGQRLNKEEILDKLAGQSSDIIRTRTPASAAASAAAQLGPQGNAPELARPPNGKGRQF